MTEDCTCGRSGRTAEEAHTAECGANLLRRKASAQSLFAADARRREDRRKAWLWAGKLIANSITSDMLRSKWSEDAMRLAEQLMDSGAQEDSDLSQLEDGNPIPGKCPDKDCPGPHTEFADNLPKPSTVKGNTQTSLEDEAPGHVWHCMACGTRSGRFSSEELCFADYGLHRQKCEAEAPTDDRTENEKAVARAMLGGRLDDDLEAPRCSVETLVWHCTLPAHHPGECQMERRVESKPTPK